MTVHAIYENGVFRPTQPVDLPDRTPVEFDPKVVGVDAHAQGEAMQAVYEIMSRRFHSGHHDTAERHNEHQP